MELILTGFLSILLFALGTLVLLLGYARYRGDAVSNRLDEFVSEDANTRNIQGIEPSVRLLSGSFLTRVLFPPIRRLSGFLGRITPAGAINRIEHQLMLAGNPYRLGAREFYGIRIVLLLLGIYLSFTFFNRGLDRLNIALALLSLIISLLLPPLWMLRMVRRRQEKIRRGLPDALDMLSVCATAGLGFDQALQRVSDYWRTDVGDEFGRTVTEMSMGISRAEALRNLAARVDIVELSTFTTLIIQSDQLGMSIADTLHSQADQMRLFRRLRAEEEIRKIPVKLLIPIGIFIFPSIIAVILGPSVPVLLDFFRNF